MAAIDEIVLAETVFRQPLSIPMDRTIVLAGGSYRCSRVGRNSLPEILLMPMGGPNVLVGSGY